MAVEFQGFSIREYAWKMRSVDVEKCWPFSGDITGDRIHSLLPPITIGRFRWWSRELAVLREDSRSTRVEEFDHRSSRRAKVKSRQPKKRSIVEIFAVAPQIEVVSDQNEGDSVGDDCNVRLSDLKRKNNHKKNKKIKNNKKNHHDDAKSTDAKKVTKHNEEPQVTFCKRLDGAKCYRGTMEENCDVVPLDRKKAAQQCISNRKKGQDQAFQVRSILKTKGNVYKVEIASGCNLKNPDNFAPSVECEKRVRFSDHSDFLSQRKREIAFFKPSICSFQNNACSPSSTVDQVSENGKASPITYFDDHHNDNTHTQHKLQPVVAEGQLTHSRDKFNLSGFLRPHLSFQEKIKNVCNKPSPPSELGTISNECEAADGCVPASTHKLNLGKKLTDYGAGCTQYFAERDFEGKAQAAPQLKSSTFALNKRNNFLSQPVVEGMHCQTLQYWSSFHESLMEQKQKAAISRQTYSGDEFMGFPLSLQGEIVQAERLHFGGFDQLLFSGLATSSSRSLPTENKPLSRSMENFTNVKKHSTETAPAKESLDLFTLRNEKRPKYFPARLGVDETFVEKSDTNSENSHRETDQTACLPASDLNFKNHSFHVWKQNDLIQNQNRKSLADSRVNQDHMLFYNTPATMRLMGKDVTVDTSSSMVQFSWARKVRTGEGITAQNSPTCTSPLHLDGPSLGSHTQQSWRWPTSDYKWDETLRSDPLKDPTPGLVTQATRGLSPYQNFHPAIFKACSPRTSCPMSDSDASFQGTVLSEPNSFMLNRQPPFPSNPHITGLPVGYSSVGVNLNPLVPAVKPSFGSPFPCLDASGPSLPTQPHGSLQSSIPWLLSTAQQAKTPLALQLSPQFSGEFPTSAAGPDYLVNESAHQFCVVNHSHGRMNSCSCTGMSSDAATQPSQTFSGFKTSSYINFGKGNKIKAGAQDAVNINKSNKRRMAVEEYSMKNCKIPRLQTQDGGLESMKELASNSPNFEMWDDGVHYTRSKHLMDDVRAASPGVEFSRNGMWTGSVKLSGGSKHVLKPSQNTNQNNPGRIMHSAIPVISFSDHNSFAGQGMKASQIYKF